MEEDVKSISTVFKKGLDLYNNLGKSDEPTNSLPVQSNIKRAIIIFQKVSLLKSYADFFSTNEGIEEVATNDLQYLLVPALLGSLLLKVTSWDRKGTVDVAEAYFKDFLRRCNDYGLSNYQFNKTDDTSGSRTSQSEIEQIALVVNTRASKIQRYKRQKEKKKIKKLKENLENLKKNMENEHVDEEIKRNYFLTMIKLFIYKAIDELNSIDMEKPILDHIATLKKNESKQEPRWVPAPPLEPIIITRNAAQKAIYGAGYPGLPTMTVEEFNEKRVKDFVFPDPSKGPSGALSVQQAALQGIAVNAAQMIKKRKKGKRKGKDDAELLDANKKNG